MTCQNLPTTPAPQLVSKKYFIKSNYKMESGMSVRDRMKAYGGSSNSSSSSSAPSRGSSSIAGRTGSNPSMNANSGLKNETVTKILEGDESISWALFTFDKNSLNVFAQGNGDVEELKANLDDGQVLFGYIRIPLGSDRRNKYVFMKWVGEDVRPIQRARAFDDGKKVNEYIKVYHIEFPITRKADLSTQLVTDRLKAAAGANYDKEQNTSAATIQQSSHEFGNYKRSSKEFFQNIERNGNLQKVVYETKPLARSTPVDLGNRQMTVGAATARANTVDLETKKDQKVTA